MTTEFPEISIERHGIFPVDRKVTFLISLSGFYKIIDDAAKLAAEKFDSIMQFEEYHGTYMTEVTPAIELLATAVAACVRCPVKQREVCTGFHSVDLTKGLTGGYEALMEVNAKNSHNKAGVSTQIEGSHCGITASQLNAIFPVKMQEGN
ncbi:MAG: hypothetical protein WC625_07570 [Caldisericia bacterium]